MISAMLDQTLQVYLASSKDCIDIIVFLCRYGSFLRIQYTYCEFFDLNGPARNTIAVRGLPHPDAIVEIKAVALRAQRSVA